ncbi:MAG: DNA-formamidopyrimidine glycosylase family protein [Cyclobacteriaceae bacterium]
MPELPEVATYKKYFDLAATGRRVTEVEVVEPRVVTVSPEELQQQVVGQRWEETQQIGKHLLVKLSEGGWMTVHFGMTGSLRSFKDREDAPRFTKVLFALDDGFFLSFRCPRILGRIGLTDSLADYQRAKKLGPDALTVSWEDFQDRLDGRSALIKPLLMNQSTVAGLGNWIVDDILYQAGIHPEKRANELTETEVRAIFDKMKYILETAIELESRYEDFHDDFLVTYRWSKNQHRQDEINLEILKVGGRSTYIDAERQRL